MNVANTILNQLGGNKFIGMTGASHFVSDGNTLRMTLPKNKSRANRLYITLEPTDTYTMRFFKYSSPRFNSKTCSFSSEKVEEIKTFTDVYFYMLQEIFTTVTGMYTHL